ncbi:hypothetical protein [Sulfurirhabdus autotrophica]|uniref:Uncharacterized protein n=1 Tax=Sulfurirhabdus autotrophica TaxID=1706046 RepID=A0A4R3Y5D0_9PROT|nr:hypothetical protein [Sulfurirhabdus autotrophica]TCV86641.1 hypothetical protein EDC63_1062 [Sulfurirhabdus autotrophica]
MDPITMILTLALKNPQVTSDTLKNFSTPGEIKVEQMQSSAADFARETLKCYHKSARFLGMNVLGTQWQGQSQYAAQSSILMRIYFSGISGTGYQMTVAAMAKENMYRTAVLQDTALIPYNKNCALEYWVTAEAQN